MGIYDTVYGIFNHIKNNQNPPSKRRPLASVAFHRAEDFTKGSLLEDNMRTFKDYPIKELFGIDYLQFMKQTTDIADLMIKVAKEHREKESKMANDADKTLRNSLKDPSGLKTRQAAQLEALRLKGGK